MGDMDDTFRTMREHSKEKRASNRESSAEYLRKHDIPFASHNRGAHLIVEGNHGFIDFWPGTGRWIDRDGRTRGFGVRNLVKHIELEPTY